MGSTKTFAPTGTVTVRGQYGVSQNFAMPAVDGTTSAEFVLTAGGPLILRFSTAPASEGNHDLALNPGAVLLIENGINPLAPVVAEATNVSILGDGTLTITRGNTTNFSF